MRPARCVVIGAGLAGAAAARSLAGRGWRVELLDASATPAAGASALPAGLAAPHVSFDDNLLSRLSRAGLRLSLAQAGERLREGADWAHAGTLERRFPPGDARCWPLPPPGSAAADSARKEAVGLAPGDAAWWHGDAAWIRPAALVHAWLDHPQIEFRGKTPVGRVEPVGSEWQLLDPQGGRLARVPLVVVAAAGGSPALTSGRVALNAVRGQVSWGRVPADVRGWPQTPVNGHGHFLPRVPIAGSLAWLCGSTFGRGDTDAAPRPQDQQENLQRLRQLLPATAEALAPAFETSQVQAWAGVRYASRDRRPLVGELAPGLWVSTAFGSRGLSFAALAGELIAARLHGEPLPLETWLAEALSPGRLTRA